MARKPADLRQRRHRGRRHLPDRLHLGHHRPAQGHDALPPRRDGRLRLLAARTCCRPTPDDIFFGTPAAGLHLRPGRAAAVPAARRRLHACCWRRLAADTCWRPSQQFGATVCFTAPTSYRAMAGRWRRPRPVGTPAQVRVGRRGAARGHARSCGSEATGIEIIDGIGATEMLHIFISRRRARGAARRHRQGGARLRGLRGRRRRPAAAAGPGRPRWR